MYIYRRSHLIQVVGDFFFFFIRRKAVETYLSERWESFFYFFFLFVATRLINYTTIPINKKDLRAYECEEIEFRERSTIPLSSLHPKKHHTDIKFVFGFSYPQTNPFCFPPPPSNRKKQKSSTISARSDLSGFPRAESVGRVRLTAAISILATISGREKKTTGTCKF